MKKTKLERASADSPPVWRLTMTTDLDAAAARLKRDLDAIAAETSGAKEARGDVRLLLADWERRGEELARIQRLPTLDWAQVTASITQRLATISRAGDTEAAKTMLAVLDKGKTYVSRLEAERDAARAEVERLKAELTSEREQWAGFVDACAQVGVTWTMRDPTPEHPIGVEIRNAAVTELARLRERDARVSLMLQRGLAGATTQGKRASVRLDWCVHAVKAALALLKETP